MASQIASPPVVPNSSPEKSTLSKKMLNISEELNKTLEHSTSLLEKRPAPLPEIRRSKTMDMQSHSEFLPDEVLFALTQPPDSGNKMGPTTRDRNLAVSSSAGRKPPANVWNHKRREKLKHLTDQALCFCGAGRDISFLYDLPKQSAEDEPASTLPKDETKIRDAKPSAKQLALPPTLLPKEYHIVKNKGVLGLEYYETVKKRHMFVVHKGAKKLRFYDDDYSTQPEDHESHLTIFPSMNPTSRYEVLRLKEVMDDMLEKAGVNDESLDFLGPTQMHNLIEVIKKEQKIYNIIFHELIRQTTVECSERGSLLADVRQRYADLLSKVPRQIKGLHEEVMAQRALDRRLTEELFRFKTQILNLTSELNDVKEHDQLVTEQAKRAQEDLRSALQESQKNASLLGEYHDLYELQRQRLERLVTILTEEKELWSTATYSLSVKIVEEGNLVTSRRAYIAEKSWSKLAHHFTVLLSDKDTEVLTRLQGHMEKWRDLMESFNLKIKSMEEEVHETLQKVKGHVKRWISDFQRNCLSKDGAFVKGPDMEKTKIIFSEIKEWAMMLQGEIDQFSGNVLLSNNECLSDIEAEIQGWSDCGVEVFGRHKQGDEYPQDYKIMLKVNKLLRDMCRQYSNRVTGENGIAKLIIQINTAFEAWENKLVSIVHAGQSVQNSTSMSSTSVSSSHSYSSVEEDKRKVTFNIGAQTHYRPPDYKQYARQGPKPTQFKNTKKGRLMKAAGKNISEWWKKKGQDMSTTEPLNKAAPVLSKYKFAEFSDELKQVESIISPVSVKKSVIPARSRHSVILGRSTIYLDKWDWMTFMENMDEWVSMLEQCTEVLGSVDSEDDKEQGRVIERIDVHDMMRKAHMWCVTANNAVDSEDSKYVEQVTQMHTQMVKWMVNMLLRLAPDRPGTSEQTIEQSMLHSPPVHELISEAQHLFTVLDNFSLHIFRSCDEIVRVRVHDRTVSGDDTAEKELNDLQGLKYEAYHWIYAACLMLGELTGESFTYTPNDTKFDFNQFSRARTARSTALEYMESRLKAEQASTPAAEGSRPVSAAADDDEVIEELDNIENDEESTAAPLDTFNTETVATSPVAPQAQQQSDEFTQDNPSAQITESDITVTASVKPKSPTTVKRRQSAESSKASTSRAQSPKSTSRPPSRPASAKGGKKPSRPSSAKSNSRPTSSKSQPPTVKEQLADENLEKIEVIGRDDNTRPALLPEPSPNEPPPRPTSGKPMAVDSQKAYDTLQTVQKLQSQLIDTEMRAQVAEDTVAKKQSELISTQEKLRVLERQLAELQAAEPASQTELPPVAATSAQTAAAPANVGTEEKVEPVKRKSSKSQARSASNPKGTKKK